MSEMRTMDGGTFRIEVSPDGMTATLCADAGAEVSAGVVIAKLKAIGVAGFDDGELIEAVEKNKGAAISLVVARGTAVVDERPGRVDFRVPVADEQNGLVAKVAARQSIAVVGPVAAGSDGRDVFGKVVAHQKAPPFQIGSGVSLVKGTLVAVVAGNARSTKGVIGVHPLMEIYGDAENSPASVNFQGDVAVKGSLRDGRSLTTSGWLVVGGAIEAATFNVGHGAFVKGGVVGREKGTGTVEGDVWCRFTSGARLSVGGDVHVQSEVAHSRIACGGRLIVTRGPICGGEITANGGVECQILGNPAEAVTTVEAGMDQSLRLMLIQSKPESEANHKRITEIREKIAPLMQHVKNLTAQQKERATELLYEADELEEATQKKLLGLSDRCREIVGRSHAEIVVNEMVYPGVIVHFPGVEAKIESAFPGPLRIFPRRCGTVVKVVMQDAGGAVCPLPSAAVADHFSPFIERLMQSQKAA